MAMQLWRAEMRSRWLVVGLFWTVTLGAWGAQSIFGMEPWSSSDARKLVVLVFLGLFGPGVAALLGADLGGARDDCWGWLLARPVSREHFFWTRWGADVLTLGLMLLCSVVLMSGDPRAGGDGMPVWLFRLFIYLCVMHAACAWAGSRGWSGLTAISVGLGALSLASLLGMGAVLLGLVLAGGSAPDILMGLVMRTLHLDANAVVLPQDLLLLAGAGAGTLGLTISGWAGSRSVWQLQPGMGPTRSGLWSALRGPLSGFWLLVGLGLVGGRWLVLTPPL